MNRQTRTFTAGLLLTVFAAIMILYFIDILRNSHYNGINNWLGLVVYIFWLFVGINKVSKTID